MHVFDWFKQEYSNTLCIKHCLKSHELLLIFQTVDQYLKVTKLFNPNLFVRFYIKFFPSIQ